MALHARLIQIEMYLPNVSTTTDLTRALSPLRRYCKDKSTIALSIESFETADRGEFSLVVVGSTKLNVEQDCEHLLTWIEARIIGQTLASNISWL